MIIDVHKSLAEQRNLDAKPSLFCQPYGRSQSARARFSDYCAAGKKTVRQLEATRTLLVLATSNSGLLCFHAVILPPSTYPFLETNFQDNLSYRNPTFVQNLATLLLTIYSSPATPRWVGTLLLSRSGNYFQVLSALLASVLSRLSFRVCF